jgi:hypothetical protein
MANRVGSILAADFGSVQTRVVLIDAVDGEYRVVTSAAGLTTLGYPVDDATVGLREIVRRIEAVAGRRLYNQHGRIIMPEDGERAGVDHFITTASAGKPMRAVIVTLTPEISLIGAHRAISGAYVEPAAEIHLQDGRTDEERLNAIVLNRPDMVFIAGGTEGGARSAMLILLNVIQLALKITDADLRPLIVYAGNSAVQEDVRTMLGDLTSVYIADNLRPDMDDEAYESVVAQLGVAYDKHREKYAESFASVRRMSSTGVLPTAQSYGLVASYYARVVNGNVIAFDIGSTAAVLSGVFGGQVSTRINTQKGLGHSANMVLDEIGEAEIARWVPFYTGAGEISNYALNKMSRPSTIPATLRDLYHEHALLRAAMQRMVHNARQQWIDVEPHGALPEVKLIVAGGASITGTGNSAYSMMLAVDCIQPSGVTEIKIDRHGIIPAMSALSRLNPDAAVQLLDGDSLEHLGAVVSFDGHPSSGQTVAKLKIKTGDGEKIDYELKGGHLLTLPVPESYTLEVDIRCSRGFKVAGKSRVKLKVRGGTAGVMFDARGRLFVPPQEIPARASLMPIWVSEATDDPVLQIPAEWLEKTHELPTNKDGSTRRRVERRKKGKNQIDEKAPSAAEDDFFSMIEAEEAVKAAADAESDDDLDKLRKLI